MGSGEPPFARHSEGIFGEMFLELMVCTLWVQRLVGVFMKRDSGVGTRLGWCRSEVSVFLLLGRCLPVWCFCSPVGKSMAVVGAGLPDALHGCMVLLSFLIDCRDLITKVGRSWQGAEDAFGCFLLLLLLFLLSSLFSSALPSFPLFSSAFP